MFNDYVLMCGAGLLAAKIILLGRKLFISGSGLGCLSQTSERAGLKRPLQTTWISCLILEMGKLRFNMEGTCGSLCSDHTGNEFFLYLVSYSIYGCLVVGAVT